jgi:hypothetical protein
VAGSVLVVFWSLRWICSVVAGGGGKTGRHRRRDRRELVARVRLAEALLALGDAGRGVGRPVVQGALQALQLGGARHGRERHPHLGGDRPARGVAHQPRDHQHVPGLLGQLVAGARGQQVERGVEGELLQAHPPGRPLDVDRLRRHRPHVDVAGEGDEEAGLQVEPVGRVEDLQRVAGAAGRRRAGRHRQVHPQAGQLRGVRHREPVVREDGGLGRAAAADGTGAAVCAPAGGATAATVAQARSAAAQRRDTASVP